MKENWLPQIFQTAEAGVSSAFEPELIPDNQLSWMKNGVIRGGKPHTRPGLKFRLVLPPGKLQGVGFFSVQNGMLIASISGRIYRIRVGAKTSGFSYEEITLPWRNSSKQDYAWMQETVGYFVIQDGQSSPIIYDGSQARRADQSKNEVPVGRQMAYGNGRLWVAINENELVAGDIKTRTQGSELLFTETQYLTGGGAFYFPRKITGLGFIPATGASGYGSLIVYAKDRTETIRADITNRDLWGTFPGFIQPVLLNSGAASHYSLTEVNQDLWWRDADGGIRSLRSSVADEAGSPGNTPQSREVARITDFEDQKRLAAVSGIQFDNRLLMTASPFINQHGAVSFRDLISLDFSPISSNRAKTAPSYDGEWDGLRFTRLVAGEFNGKRRGFALSLDPDGYNRLWEFDDGINDDELQICTGTGLATMESPIPMVLEYPSRDWGLPSVRKVLQRCDVYLAGVEGEVKLDVYWRSDNLVKWNRWQEEVTACATMSDASTATPHVWKNLAPQGRAQIKTFSVPQTTQPLTGYGNQTGFEHQIRLVVTGKAKVDRVVVYAERTTQEAHAFRDPATFSQCMEQDITGNEIVYDPVSAGCTMPVGTAQCELTYSLSPEFAGTWSLSEYPVGVDPLDVTIASDGPTDNATVTVPDLGDYVFTLTAGTRTLDYPVFFSVGESCCISMDPLPYTVDFDSLSNLQPYTGSAQYGLLPVDDLAEFIPSDAYPLGRANWAICPYCDFCDGPEIEGVTQEERYTTRWFVNSSSAPAQYGVDGVSSQDVPANLFVGVDQSEIFTISLGFDSNARPAFAIQTGTGQIEIRREVAGVPTVYSFAGDYPRLLYDGILQRDSSSIDLVCFYVSGGGVKMRFQRDNFGVEYDFVTATPNAVRVTKTDRIDACQLLYFTDSDGALIAARSEVYPPFPILVSDLGTNSAAPAGGEYMLGVVDGGSYSDAGTNAAAPAGGEYVSNTVNTGPYTDDGTNMAAPAGGEYAEVVVSGGAYSESATNSASPATGEYTEVSVNGGTYTENATNSAAPSGGEYEIP